MNVPVERELLATAGMGNGDGERGRAVVVFASKGSRYQGVWIAAIQITMILLTVLLPVYSASGAPFACAWSSGSPKRGSVTAIFKTVDVFKKKVQFIKSGVPGLK
ncbi:hypothetical protein C8F04DRAFT_1191916 [Mycena alexandri]|uniref:Uncharacterized protein n=1 Tax=Mycena alexandri TaxID=1745969 RepID=A0AAD6SGJ0_9AGAR|nr:hypothetical protein C8F04DRAFT_1191916 [Mycena alexandri]